MKRSNDGVRYQIGLLWKADDIVLPPSYTNALHRLKCQERKMDKDFKFAEAYCKKIEEYSEKGFIRKLDKTDLQNSHPRTWYLPHFGVVNPNKPGKLRLVFDAASKSHGVSLNDNLCQGPDLNNSIVSVLLRFRQYQFAYAGDLKDMFHRVFISEEDRHSQRFLWRGMNRDCEPSVYQLEVMMFGASSSPACAQFVKNKNANLFEKEEPVAARVTKKNFYVDDCLHSAPTEEEAVSIINGLIKIQASAGFEICNWMSNSPTILKGLPQELLGKEINGLDLEKNSLPDGRVLGMWWNPHEDYFSFRLNFHKVKKEVITGEMRPTKRQILRLVMSIYDPLGFLGHLIVKAKILLQDVWRTDLGWDDEITESLYSRWTRWIAELQGITEVKIPRCYSNFIPQSSSVQLHIFCDASEKAFTAVGFIRVKVNEVVNVNIVAAKTRVSPLKVLSIPRLELQAAVMGARLSSMIKQELEFEFQSVTFWTDSTTVLKWIRSDAKNFKNFVAHRLGEILEMSESSQWRWVPTKENVADDGTRDNLDSDLSSTSRWFHGPAWLKDEPRHWPQEASHLADEQEDDEGETKKYVNIIQTNPSVIEIERFSKLLPLLRTAALVYRWVSKSQNMKKQISVSELQRAELYWCGQVQKESFPEEVQLLTGGKPISKKSRLYKLDPKLCEDNLLRLRGRTGDANIPLTVTEPIILDNRHPFTKLLISHYHEQNGHQGVQTVANELRQKFWILNRVSAVKKAFLECQLCKNRKAEPHPPRMADLPAVRLENFYLPFSNCGLDYFGPMEVVIGRRHEKRWGALFTCLSTRAVHVEVANSLTTDSAINAIRRFGNRRGHPSNIYCDNGTNFRGAEAELRKAIAEVRHDKVATELVKKGIQFHFIPAASPHFGGVWERMVGSVKKVLTNILKSTRTPTEEILHTFLTEAENIVNSRPLTEVSVDPDDPNSITPNHFLLGWSNGSAGPVVLNQEIIGSFHQGDLLKKGWRAAQKLADMFWQRWIKEYLPTLTRRTKWLERKKPIQVDDIVIVVDDQAPRNQWEKGRIINVFPGKDGQVRAVDVKTSKGMYRRPAVKIAVLDVKRDEATVLQLPLIGGKNVEE